MGINLVNKNIQIGHIHNRGVNTSVSDNPTTSNVGDLTVFQIFSRNKDQRLGGDESPQIYAMKDIKGHTIVPMYRGLLMRHASQIVAKLGVELQPDYDLPVPSSKAFVDDLSTMVRGVIGSPVLPCGFIRKKNLGELVVEYGGEVPDLMPGHQTAHKQQMGVWRKANPDILVSMKDVDTAIRDNFKPMVLDGAPPNLDQKHVLIVV